jgi:nitrogenase molybdenum-iron protein alpha/beta subunit
VSIDELDSLWIIDSKGLCLLQQVFNPTKNSIDKTMFSGFVTAILSFSDQIFDDSLEQISMGKLTVHCLKKGNFIVAIATKKEANQQFIHQKMLEVADAFDEEYGDDLIDGGQPVCIDDYATFSDTIDKIFGTKTTRVLREHNEFLELLTRAEEEQYSESETIETILNFYEQIPSKKRNILLQTTFPILSMFIESKNLTVEQIKRFQEVLSIQEESNNTTSYFKGLHFSIHANKKAK